MSELFKDKITKTHYQKQAKGLYKAIGEGDTALKQFLLGTADPEEYKDHGKYYLGKHGEDDCSRVTGDGYDEDQLCKCLYFYNRGGSGCDLPNCTSPRRYTLAGPYQIMDYQVPAHYYGSGIGKIDLVLTDGETLYATEVKPPKHIDKKSGEMRENSESLLRMVAEIMTYTLGTTQYKKAIAFFENTPQDEEYGAISSTLKEILKKAKITVFRFEKREGDTYEICKL